MGVEKVQKMKIYPSFFNANTRFLLGSYTGLSSTSANGQLMVPPGLCSPVGK